MAKLEGWVAKLEVWLAKLEGLVVSQRDGLLS